MSPKEPSGASKKQKTACSKTLENLWSLKVFGYRDLSGEPQEAQEGSQKAPTKIQDHKKRGPKLDPKIITFWTNFGAHFGTQKQSKKTQKKNILGTPFPRISGVQIMPRQNLYERGEKAILTGIILYKRKGGIRPYRALFAVS